uniref:3-demethylubiquinol 3-O-methyltransferase n=1 Tax=Panagrolaimus davidi TaxID=227884 RepID=A0A914PAK2_9BILA
MTSRIFAIWLAENVLGIVPPGVHDWEKLVEPEKLHRGLEERNCRVSKPLGVVYNPVTNRWSWSSFDLVNYAVIAKRS